MYVMYSLLICGHIFTWVQVPYDTCSSDFIPVPVLVWTSLPAIGGVVHRHGRRPRVSDAAVRRAGRGGMVHGPHPLVARWSNYDDDSLLSLSKGRCEGAGDEQRMGKN